MAQAVQTNVKELFLSGGSFGAAEVEQLIQAIGEDQSQYRLLREGVQELETAETAASQRLRLGVAYYLLGRYRLAVEALSGAETTAALAPFYLGKTHFGLQQYDEALEAYQKAAKAGYNADAVLPWRGPRRCAARATPRRRWRSWTSSPAPSSRRPNTSISAARRSRPWAAIRTKSWPSSSGPSRSIRGIPAHCSAWPRKTIAAATTRRPCGSTSGRRRGCPRMSARC